MVIFEAQKIKLSVSKCKHFFNFKIFYFIGPLLEIFIAPTKTAFGRFGGVIAPLAPLATYLGVIC